MTSLIEKMRSFFDTPEEIFVWTCLQFPLYFIIHWHILWIAPICGILGRLGGWEFGDKLYRRLGVPLVVCGATYLTLHHWTILLAVPFMVWLAPSYGVDSWLFKLIKNDFLTRIICYLWYWAVFSLAYLIH